jgi:hypothetical protein
MWDPEGEGREDHAEVWAPFDVSVLLLKMQYAPIAVFHARVSCAAKLCGAHGGPIATL